MTNNCDQVRYPGRRAARGRAIGRSVVVDTETDLASVRVGDVLVAAQTDIAYVPAMLRASAIITETGGRFSHAAVWARENNKPTLLQVVNATVLLRDACKVLVNADDQYVEVLESGS
jgi:phosphoenolpyruvate synthase/pyruvate phosphate dikinase